MKTYALRLVADELTQAIRLYLDAVRVRQSSPRTVRLAQSTR